jgi:hypothetical protein
MKRHLAWLVAVAVAVPSFAAAPDLAKLLDQADLKYEQQDRGRIKLLFEFEDGRSHLVYLQPQEPYDGVEIVEIYATVMPLTGGTVPAALSRRLLEVNGSRKVTYFGIEDVEGTPYVFCYHNMPTEGLTPKVLSSLLNAVASFADEMEKEQLGASSDDF